MMQHDSAGGPVARDYGDFIGTPFKVFLRHGVSEHHDEAGKLVIDINDLPGLISSILQSRVLHPRKLCGDDLKFVRRALRMRSAAVAEVLDVTPEHYSRCEAGTKTLSAAAEKSYRMYVFLRAACRYVLAEENSVEYSPEKARRVMDAFKSVFLEMKIQHIFDPNDELVFSFVWRVCRDCSESDSSSGEDGRWHKQLEAA